jgi:hypothetical protein
VRVGAEQRFSGNAKTLLVNEMAGAVTGAPEPHAEAPGGALKQYVVVGVVGFNQEMVAVGDRSVPAYLLDAHGLELKSAQRTGSIFSAISSPGRISPATRWFAMSSQARLLPMIATPSLQWPQARSPWEAVRVGVHLFTKNFVF